MYSLRGGFVTLDGTLSLHMEPDGWNAYMRFWKPPCVKGALHIVDAGTARVT
jgi:hypothetical protein